MTAHASRRKQLLYIILIVIGAGFVLIYRGIGWPFVRGYVGDWLIVQLMYVLVWLWIMSHVRIHHSCVRLGR